jgi:hypothetical protein
MEGNMHNHKISLFLSSIAAMSLGWAFPYLQLFAMQYVTIWTPFPRLLHRAGLSESEFVWALFPIDFLTWVLIALPIAFLLTRLRPIRPTWYTALATLPFFIVVNILLLMDGTLHPSDLSVRMWASWLFVLPSAVLIVQWISRVRPNSSFKPKPLRGSA